MLRTRIAPTPSGFLHLGNAWSFTLTWLAARSSRGGGHVRLRLDDLDASRVQAEYIEDVFASLAWLGLDFDAGPRDAEEFAATHSQRLRLDRYRAATDRLRADGHLYACACSRAALRAAGPLYPGICRARGLDVDAADHALRFRVPDAAVSARDADGGRFALHPARIIGDFVVRRRDGEPAYQLASIVDDEEHGINFVVRGTDLTPSTGAQLALAGALGLETFPHARFWHHPLVLDEAGEKLSKSRGAESLRALRARFPDPAPVFRWFAMALGHSPEAARQVATARDLLAGFDPAAVSARLQARGDSPLRLAGFRRFTDGTSAFED